MTTNLLIKYFNKKGYGQFIRKEGPSSHKIKKGTPTMGGIPIIFSTSLTYFIIHIIFYSYISSISIHAIYLIILTILMSAVGCLDDFMKIFQKKSLGLKIKTKLFLQSIVALIFSLYIFYISKGITNNLFSMRILFVKYSILDFAIFGSILGALLFILWSTMVIISTANAINLSDGLDGLAAGSSIAVLLIYLFICSLQANKSCIALENGFNHICHDTSFFFDISILSSSLIGALVGFLWWNIFPAQVFMGDTGSLGIGSLIAGIAIITKTELLLIIIGGLFVIITLSVVLQVLCFKITKGKRVFKMTPLQHHYELLGIPEAHIVVRFWIVSMIFSLIGLLIFCLG